LRREYSIIGLRVNGRVFNRVLIDPHVDKHSDHINDELILQLIYKLRGNCFIPIRSHGGFEYFLSKIKMHRYCYKLIWITDIKQDFIGIITAYRDRRLK